MDHIISTRRPELEMINKKKELVTKWILSFRLITK